MGFLVHYWLLLMKLMAILRSHCNPSSTSNCNALLRGDVHQPLSAKLLFIAKIFALLCLLFSATEMSCVWCQMSLQQWELGRAEPKLRARRATPNRNGDTTSTPYYSKTSNTTEQNHVLQEGQWFYNSRNSALPSKIFYPPHKNQRKFSVWNKVICDIFLVAKCNTIFSQK